MRSHRLFWGIAFAGFWLIWVLANYPALTHAWWYRDDFTFGWIFATSSPLVGFLTVFSEFAGDGRPFAILNECQFCVNQYPHTGLNVLCHWAQGLAHVSLALFIAVTLGRHLPRWQAALAVLPFLLWCFNGEVALYSSASHYLLSAFFSLLGMRLIVAGIEQDNIRWLRIGAILTLISVLTVQPAAAVGIMVWVMILALRFIATSAWGKTCLREGLWLGGSYVAGGLLSTWLTMIYHAPRAKIATDTWDKIGYWAELNRTFLFWPGFYPTELSILHGLLLVLGLAVPAFVFLRAGRPLALLVIFALLGVGFILPYAATLVVASDSIPFRSLYFAPLTFSLILVVLFTLARRSVLLTGSITVLIAAICLSYIPVAQDNARDYVRLYAAETVVVHALEKAAAANHTTSIGATPDVGSDNPFGLRYAWGDGHACDFEFLFAVRPCIELLSSFKLQRTTFARPAESPEKTLSIPAPPGVRFDFLQDSRLLYLQVD